LRYNPCGGGFSGGGVAGDQTAVITRDPLGGAIPPANDYIFFGGNRRKIKLMRLLTTMKAEYIMNLWNCVLAANLGIVLTAGLGCQSSNERQGSTGNAVLATPTNQLMVVNTPRVGGMDAGRKPLMMDQP